MVVYDMYQHGGIKVMKKDKTYLKESIECYVFCFSLTLLFSAVAIIAGQVTGADWFGLFKQLYVTAFK